MKNYKTRIIFFICLCLAASAWDSPGARAAEGDEGALRLSLQDCIRLTLENNLDISREAISPRINQTRVVAEEAVFDPSLNMEMSKGVNENRGPSRLAGASVSRQENLYLNLGAAQKLKSGGTLELDFNNREFRTNSSFVTINPYYDSGLIMSLTQPLLKNRGRKANETQIKIAVNNRRISYLKLRGKIIDIVSEAQRNYWDLVYRREYLKVKELLLKQARDLLVVNRAKVEVGALPKFGIEILEAESSVAARQAEVLAAQDALRDGEDRLKRAMNIVDKPGGWQTVLLPSDSPRVDAVAPQAEESVRAALDNRPDYLSLQQEIKNQRLDLQLADNRLWPDLDLVAQWGLNSLGSSYGENLKHLADLNYRTWLLGVNLEIPWGNRTAKSSRLEKKFLLEQKELEIKDQGHQVTLEVREAVRQIKTDWQRIAAGKINRELERKNLLVAEEYYKAGKENFTVHELLEYQVQLAEAKINYLKAVIDYNNSLINLSVKKGTLLEEKGIVLEKLFPETGS